MTLSVSTAADTRLLAHLAEQKYDCLRQLHEMAQRQFALIDSEQSSELLRLLAAKQRLLGMLQTVDQSLAPFRGQAPESRVWESESLRRRTADNLALCERLLTELIALEQQGEVRLAAQRDRMAERVRAAWSVEELRDVYTQEPDGVGQQLDLSTDL